MHHYRKHSVDYIIEELKYIEEIGFTHVAFVDDSFLFKGSQAEELFDQIIYERINLKFYITAARVDSADIDLYKKMRKAGVVYIQFGLESGNQDVLDFYNKHVTLKQIREAVNISHKTGFFTAGTFILGAPFETPSHFHNTVKFANTLPLDSVSFLPLRYMVGSILWKTAVEEGRIREDEYVVIAGREHNLGWFTQRELISYCRLAQLSFYLRPSFPFKMVASALKK